MRTRLEEMKKTTPGEAMALALEREFIAKTPVVLQNRIRDDLSREVANLLDFLPVTIRALDLFLGEADLSAENKTYVLKAVVVTLQQVKEHRYKILNIAEEAWYTFAHGCQFASSNQFSSMLTLAKVIFFEKVLGNLKIKRAEQIYDIMLAYLKTLEDGANVTAELLQNTPKFIEDAKGLFQTVAPGRNGILFNECERAVHILLDSYSGLKEALTQLTIPFNDFKAKVANKLSGQTDNMLVPVVWSFQLLDVDDSKDVDIAEFIKLTQLVQIECEVMKTKARGGQALVDRALEGLEVVEPVLASQLKVEFISPAWKEFSQKAFAACDFDNNNAISAQESPRVFQEIIKLLREHRQLGVDIARKLSECEDSLECTIIQPAWRTLDSNGSGSLEFAEFDALLRLTAVHVMGTVSEFQETKGQKFVVGRIRQLGTTHAKLATRLRLDFLSQEFHYNMVQWFQRYDASRDGLIQESEARGALLEYFEKTKHKVGGDVEAFQSELTRIFATELKELDLKDGALTLDGFAQAMELCEIAVSKASVDSKMGATNQETELGDISIGNLLVHLVKRKKQNKRAEILFDEVYSMKLRKYCEWKFSEVDKKGNNDGMIDDMELMEAFRLLVSENFPGFQQELAGIFNDHNKINTWILQLHDVVGSQIGRPLNSVQFYGAMKWLYVRIGSMF